MKLVLLCLLTYPLLLFGAKPIAIEYKNGVFSLSQEPKIAKSAGAPKAAFWKYHWEFGDNHYFQPKSGRGEKVEHPYAKSGWYEVRAYLTPYYSNRKDTVIVNKVWVDARPNSRSSSSHSLDPKESALIRTNVIAELVPGENIRVILHFKAPNPPGKNSVSGRLFLGFNELFEKVSNKELPFDPLTFDKTSVVGQSIVSLPDSSSWKYRNHLGNATRLGWKISNLKPEQEYRVFLTLKSDARLSSILEKRKSQDPLIIPLKVIWKPDYGQLNAISYELKVMPVHDPNKMWVNPVAATFYPGYERRLEYTIKFENDSEQEVRNMDIRVPWDKTLIPGSLKFRKFDPEVPICYEEHDHDKNPEGCMYVDSSAVRYKGEMVFHFHNIYLSGTGMKNTKNRDAQGKLSFSVLRNNVKKGKTKLRGIVAFHGGLEEKLNKVSTSWRYKTWGVMAGATVDQNLNLAGFPKSKDILPYLAPGFWYQNMPLQSGVGYSGSVRYFPMYSQVFENRADLSSAGAISGISSNKRQLDVKNLDLNVELKANLSRHLSIGVNAGIFIPIWAKSESQTITLSPNIIESNFRMSPRDVLLLDPIFVHEEFVKLDGGNGGGWSSIQRFGWLQPQKDSLSLRDTAFARLPPSRRRIGYSFGVSLETGLSGDLMLGYRQQFSFLNKSYLSQALQATSGELYLKVRLGRMKK